jgi:hypothetical protein
MYSNNIRLGDANNTKDATNRIRRDGERLKTRSTAPI